MRTFQCEHSNNPGYFENTRCTRCHHELGVEPAVLRVSALQQMANGHSRGSTQWVDERRYRKCDNDRDHDVCHWPSAPAQPIATAALTCCSGNWFAVLAIPLPFTV